VVLNRRYPFKRFGMPPSVTVTPQKGHITIQLKNEHILAFSSKAAIYRYDVIVLFFNAKGKAADSVVMSSKWFQIHEAAGIIPFDAEVPKNSRLYLICLRIHGGKDDDALNELGSQGMYIKQAGMV
jgi:hypothetical protein